MAEREYRYAPVAPEMRQSGDGHVEFRGLAAPFEQVTDLGPFREKYGRKAFNRTMNNADVRFLVNHDGVPLARTKSGTLQLDRTDDGLAATAPNLDLANPKVQEIRSAMDRGDLDQMSTAFRVVRDAWDNSPEDGGKPIRTLEELELFDVSVVTYPAYESTTADLIGRSIKAVAEQRGLNAGTIEVDPPLADEEQHRHSTHDELDAPPADEAPVDETPEVQDRSWEQSYDLINRRLAYLDQVVNGRV